MAAADGIRSRSYSVIVGHGVPARPTRFLIYRALSSIDQAVVDPEIDEKFPILENGMSSTQLWMGFVSLGLIISLLKILANHTPEKVYYSRMSFLALTSG